MGVEFLELGTVQITAAVDGVVFVSGDARAIAIAAGTSETTGTVYVTGDAELEEIQIVVTPPVPTIVDGSVYASGDATMSEGVGIDVDGSVYIGGEAVLATVDATYLAAVDGTVFVSGEANSEPAFNGYYSFATEYPEEVSCYVGVSFAQMSDNVQMQMDSAPLYIQVLLELARLNQLRTPRYEGTASAFDLLALRDRLSFVIRMAIAEGVVLDGDFAPTFTAVARVLNRLILSGTVRNEAEATRLLTDAFVLLSAMDAFQTVGVAESISVADFVSALHTAVGQALERILLAGTLGGSHLLTMVLRDTFAAGATLASEVDLVAALREAVGVAMTLSFDDGLYTAWVLNTESSGLSTYSNYPFNSFAKVGGRYYGLHTGGLVRLGGDTDDGEDIAAKLRFGMFDFNDRHLKAFSEAYVGATVDGDLLLKVIFVNDGSGEKTGAIYRMKSRPAAAVRETRFELGKGLRAVDWDFELENVDGAMFDLHTIQFQPMALSRRTRG